MIQPAHVQTSLPGFKLGRLAPHSEHTHERLKLADFLLPGYAVTVPPAVDYVSKVSAWPVFANDQLGDCTSAAAGHMREALTCYGQGTTTITTDADVLAMYEATSGYIPGRPDTDNGAVMQDVLGYWRQTGLAGDRIVAFFQVDPANLAEVKTALYLFGALYVGVNLPTSALDQFQSAQPWDWSPSSDNTIEGGHCVHGGALDATGLMTVTTWGRTQKVTPAWWAHFTEECWAVASEDWVRGNTSPEGLDIVALNAAFVDMTHTPGPGPFVANPVPTPPPGPTPAPVASVADQALAAQVSPAWLNGFHMGSTATVRGALRAWFKATGLTPGGK